MSQREIDQHQPPFELTHVWVTLDLVDLHGPLTSAPWVGAMFTDYQAADEVQFVSHPGEWFAVCRSEVLRPYGRTEYHRWLLLPSSVFALGVWPPLSPPPAPPPPPPATPVEPGPGCGTPGVITGAGYYSLSEMPDNTEGHYRIELPSGGPWTISVPFPTGDFWEMFFHFQSVGNSCCIGGTPISTLVSDGAHEATISFSPTELPASLCVTVALGGEIGGGVPVGLLVELA